MAKSIKLGSDTFLSIVGIDGLVAEQLPDNANWDDYKGTHKNKVYYVGDASGMTNAAGSWGFVIFFSFGSIHSQIFIAFAGSYIAIRGTSSGSWGNWRRINAT